MLLSNKLQTYTGYDFCGKLAQIILLGTILVPGYTAFAATDATTGWSAPVNLGTLINSTASDQQPAISPDGLSLYFASNRSLGVGGFDMYVSHRATVTDPWGSPVNLGSALNTTADEGNPTFSRNGLLLFFQSKRLPSIGGIDIWVAQRNNSHDDFSWQPAVNLGANVNSADDDTGPCYFEDNVRGTRHLLFGSARPGLGGTDIYSSEQMADDSFAPATLVAELSSPLNETRLSIRHNGLEIFFQSNRTGSIGGGDLWVATRGKTSDAWSTPVSLGTTINTASAEQNPSLSSDSLTLFFSSDRTGGSGGLDLYVSTRSVISTPNWSNTGNLNSARDSHTATRLNNGKVLVAGGNDSNGTLKSAELYDPAIGTWTNTGNLNASRAFHTATLLLNGKVLIAGGFTCAPPPATCSDLNSAELYDPLTGTWSLTGNLNGARSSHTATLLPNGKVLVAGGSGDTAELYDPIGGNWSSTGSLNLNYTLVHHTATLLSSGKVLLAGGSACGSTGCLNETNFSALYDPLTGTWSPTANLNTARAQHTATVLPNGKVLIAGGFSDSASSTVSNSAELYDPAIGIWSITGNLNTGRAYHTATLLPNSNGSVLLAGGFNVVNGLPNITNAAELYNAATGTWGTTASLNSGRRFHTGTLLSNGKVLVTSGSGAGNTAELYTSGLNPIDDVEFFVKQHYLDFLNRDADASGLTFWTEQINSCGTDPICREVKGVNVSAAFFLSIEFQQTGYLVYRSYKASYGNIPSTSVPLRLHEFLPDTRAIGQGVIVNQPGWEQVLENNKQAFFNDLAQRSRFTAAYPTSLAPGAFVDSLFANAGVTPSTNDRTAAVNEFGSATNTSDVGARARALRRVAENQTLAQQEFNRAFVLMQYFGYLRRNPTDSPEFMLDYQGYNFWLKKLTQFNGNFVSAEMVKAFLVSREYRERFAP